MKVLMSTQQLSSQGLCPRKVGHCLLLPLNGMNRPSTPSHLSYTASPTIPVTTPGLSLDKHFQPSKTHLGGVRRVSSWLLGAPLCQHQAAAETSQALPAVPRPWELLWDSPGRAGPGNASLGRGKRDMEGNRAGHGRVEVGKDQWGWAGQGNAPLGSGKGDMEGNRGGHRRVEVGRDQ